MSGIRSRQVPVWRGSISIVLSVINSGPNNYYGIDRIAVCTGSGMYRLHCIFKLSFTKKIIIYPSYIFIYYMYLDTSIHVLTAIFLLLSLSIVISLSFFSIWFS